MIIDFNREPINSIIYTSGILLAYLKDKNNSRNLDDIYNFCRESNMNHNNIFLSIDWLYLIGVIETISQSNDMILSKEVIDILENLNLDAKSLIIYRDIKNTMYVNLNEKSISKEIITLNSNKIYSLIKEKVIKISEIEANKKLNNQKIREYTEIITAYYFYKFNFLFNKDNAI